jgi:hypothetical protein
VDQDDPEKRIAELEHQLAEQKRIAELEHRLATARVDHTVEQPRPPSPAMGKGEGSSAGRGPSLPVVLGFLLIPIVLLYVVVQIVTSLFVSSALWMSPIMCGSPYHMAYKYEGYHIGSGGSSGYRGGYQCLNAASSYHVNYFAVTVVQTLLVLVVLVGAVALVVMTLRVTRNGWLAWIVFILSVVGPLTGAFVFGGQ